MDMPVSKSEYLESYRKAQEKAVAYVKEVGGAQIWSALWNMVIVQKITPFDAAHELCKEDPSLWGPFTRAVELAGEWIWQQRPISSAVGGLVNSMNSDFSVNA